MILRTGLIFGFALWALATAIFVPFGRFVFGPDNALPVPVSVALSIAGTFAACYFLGRRVLARASATSLERAALLGSSLCVPGLLLDGSLMALGGGRYPGLDAAASGAMSSGLLFAYAAALLGATAAGRSLLLRGYGDRGSR